jgi:hypothetical protein
MHHLCEGPLARIPNANTGARADASPLAEWLTFNWRRFRRKLCQSRRSIATEESWPDWHYYVAHSRKLNDLWQRPNPQATDLFRRVLPASDVRPNAASYEGDAIWLLIQMLTLKLWFEQRPGGSTQPAAAD